MAQHPKSKFVIYTQGLARLFADRTMAFWFALLGILAQISHNTMTAFELSSFDGTLRIGQAILVASFLSLALLYFILKSDEDDPYSKSLNFVSWFAIFEIATNIYYWFSVIIWKPLHKHYALIERVDELKAVYKNSPDLAERILKLTFDPLYHFSWGVDVNWANAAIALVFAIALPLTIKAYGGEIRAFHEDILEESQEDQKSRIQSEITNSVAEEVKEILERLWSMENHVAFLENLILMNTYDLETREMDRKDTELSIQREIYQFESDWESKLEKRFEDVSNRIEYLEFGSSISNSIEENKIIDIKSYVDSAVEENAETIARHLLAVDESNSEMIKEFNKIDIVQISNDIKVELAKAMKKVIENLATGTVRFGSPVQLVVESGDKKQSFTAQLQKP